MSTKSLGVTPSTSNIIFGRGRIVFAELYAFLRSKNWVLLSSIEGLPSILDLLNSMDIGSCSNVSIARGIL